jgi:hypothetical protein
MLLLQIIKSSKYMNQREFIDCLNKEPKAFNCNFGSLIGGGIMLALLGFSKGLFFGLGAGVAGFIIGGYVSRQWFLGNLQRKIYWQLPFANIWLDRNAPASSMRKEL